MSETPRTDPAHGDGSDHGDHIHGDTASHGTRGTYLKGFFLSVILTAIPFWAVMTDAFKDPSTAALVIMVFAVVQIVVHMIYFLHMTSKSEGGWTMMALIFTIILVIITLSGSIWVMYHLNANMMPVQAAAGHVMRVRPATIAAGFAALLLFAGFTALGLWQVHRLAWKRDLIARVDARAHAAPVAPPGPRDWPGVTAARDAYRRVVLTGVFANESETLVRAATRLGSGYWVMTPLRTRGFTVLVNRGFVSPEQRIAHRRPSGPVTTTGYLRITEPRGGFLRSNDPAADRWYSRDVAAIAVARRIGPVAPYFIDADRMDDAAPVGGLTVIAFPNSHLAYLLTWFALAALTLVAFGLFLRHDARREVP